MSSPRAAIVLGVDDRRFVQQLRGAGQKFQTWASRTSAAVSGALKSAFGGLSDIAGIAGAGGIAYLAKQTIDFEREVTRLGVSANKSRGQMLQFAGQLGDLAAKTGVNRDEILAGAQAYVAATGDLDGFAGSMETLAKVQVATGASMTDLSKISATLQQSLNIDPSQMMQVFDTLAVQAKAGSVELPDMAPEFQGLAVGFSKFGQSGPQAVAALGAWMQTLKKGAPSAAEASNQLQNLMGAIGGKGADKLEKAGIQVYTNRKTGEMRALNDIMDDFISKVDAADTTDFFNDKQVRDAIASYRKFHDTFVDLKDPAKSQGTIMKDFATNSETAGQRIARLQEKLKATFTDVISRHLDDIVRLVEKLVGALEWVAAHPEAVAAMALMFKGGGFLSSMGNAGTPGVGGAVPGTAGGGRMAIAGGMLQGAGIGYGVGRMLGLDEVSSAATGVVGALGALPGPIGAFAKGLGLLEAGILGVIQDAENAINEHRDAVVKSDHYTAAGQLGLLDGHGPVDIETSGVSSVSVLGKKVVAGSKMSQEKARALMASAQLSGFWNPQAQTFDFEGYSKSVNADKALPASAKAALIRQAPLAFAQTMGDDEFLASHGDPWAQGRRDRANGPYVFGAHPLSPLNPSAVFGGLPEPLSPAEMAAAGKPVEVKVVIEDRSVRGVKATVDGDPDIRSRGPRQ